MNTPQHFMAVRNLDRDSSAWPKLSNVERAARYLYINKTCYNGLMRVNRRGQLNSSFGGYVNPCICPEAEIRALHEYLSQNDITILCGDYTAALANLGSGDAVYFDPPYVPVSETTNFTSYTSSSFGIDEQVRLADTCRDLDRRGVKWLLSNSSVPLIHDLYSDYTIETVSSRRAINCKGDRHGAVEEVLIRNYDTTNH